MKALYPSVGMERLCRLFGKSRQAFYDHTWRQSDEEMQEDLIIDLVKTVPSSLPNVGGLKLLHILSDELAAHHITIGRDSFFALLKKYNLLVRKKKRYAITTWSGHHYKKWQDLIKGQPIEAAEQTTALFICHSSRMLTQERLWATT